MAEPSSLASRGRAFLGARMHLVRYALFTVMAMGMAT